MPAAPWVKVLPSALTSRSWKAWRAVEAQHVVSTLRLTGNDPVAQDQLETILEASKPPLPPNARHLHYLLATPFRYPPSAHGSRFRASFAPGVLYAAVERRTACAELGYWRWRFLNASEGLKEIPAAPQTLFQLGARGQGLDLTLAPLNRWRHLWTQPDSYASTQALAAAARQLPAAWLAYSSVRDPQAGLCYAILEPLALRPARPLSSETWYLTVTSQQAIWRRAGESCVFTFALPPGPN
jgi:hypothetical protein